MILRMKGKKRLPITVKCSTYFFAGAPFMPGGVLAADDDDVIISSSNSNNIWILRARLFWLRRMTSFNQLSVIRQGGNICLRPTAAANDDVAILEVKNWKHLFKSH
jgi:hypothetical protein